MTTTGTEPVTIDAAGLTDIGRVRETNEDHFVVATVSKSVAVDASSLPGTTLAGRLGTAGARLFAVADGVGGRPGGELASEWTVTALLDYVGHTAECFQGLDPAREHELLDRLEATIRSVHERLLGETRGPVERVPATTITMVLLAWPRAYWVHVGDSRLYVSRRGRLQRVTRDQTVGDYMVSVGAWTEAQAARPGPAAALASAVGGSDLLPAVGLIDLEAGDALLLCTDGLHKHVPDERIAALLAQPDSAAATCRALVDLALAGGGTDNVTVIVVKTT
ncbi:MAG: PP2C family protein-serine/threonine phosphatase [Gemmatimonadales bacterium]